MTVINGLGPTTPAARTAGRMGSGGFAVPAEPSAAGLAGTAAASEVSLAGLLALQAEAAEDVHDRAARRRGHDILEELDALRHALLKGGVDPGALQRLAGLAVDLPDATDSRLRAVMEQIALRALVELARHGLA